MRGSAKKISRLNNWKKLYGFPLRSPTANCVCTHFGIRCVTIRVLRSSSGSRRNQSHLSRRRKRGRSGSHCFGSGLGDRKSTRLNSSHLGISYAVFCLKKKKKKKNTKQTDIKNTKKSLA